MKFYLKKPGSTDFSGPNTPEEIRAQLLAGTLGTDCEAVEATGQSLAALKRTTDWVPLSSVCSPEDIAAARPSVVSPTQNSKHLKQRQFTVIGAIIGATLAYPLSYFFQPAALRAKISLGQYIEHFSDVVGSKDLQSTVIVSFVIGIAVAAAIGFALGRSADQKK